MTESLLQTPTVGYQYCISRLSSSYSVSCPDCCCYSDYYQYYPFCCSCSHTSDLWKVWLILAIALVIAAFLIVVIIQVVRRKKQLKMQTPFLDPNLPRNPYMETNNHIIYAPQNNPRINNYQPPTNLHQQPYLQAQNNTINQQQVYPSNQGYGQRQYQYENENKEVTNHRLVQNNPFQENKLR